MTHVAQVGGGHYEYGDVGNQHWDIVDRWDIEYLVATATKYPIRYDRKGTPRLDLEKSISYLQKQLACHPNKGCRRTIPVQEMISWYNDNDLSDRKRLILELVLVAGTPKALRRAIEIMAETIAREYPEYNAREMEIINANRS